MAIRRVEVGGVWWGGLMDSNSWLVPENFVLVI